VNQKHFLEGRLFLKKSKTTVIATSINTKEEKDKNMEGDYSP
jgi:hypothetical protein